MKLMNNMSQFLMIGLISCFFITSHLQSAALTSPEIRCLPDQKTALLQLKQMFTIEKPAYFSDTFYPRIKSWKAGTDCCSWDGVTCDAKNGQVVGLDLSSCRLFGPISSNSSLFSLNHLQRLNLALNNFNLSMIPPEFGKLTRLTHLNLSYSQFSGQIPLEIAWLTKLVSLDLSSGTSFFESLLYLEKPILGMLFQNLTNLKVLHLNQVNISSSIPEYLANLTSLTSLSLKNCELRGEFPKKVFLLPDLQTIYLSGNGRLSGFLPEFHSGSSLKTLDLSWTNFFGELPHSVGNLMSLNVLDLYHCSFTGIIPNSLWNLTQLTYLSLSFNNFSGIIPSSLGNLAKLTYLSLGSSYFSGKIPSSLENLTLLTYLDLSYNEISGPIPSTLANLKQLSDLILSGNQIDGELPSSLANLTQLVSLDISYNQLIGPVPSEISRIPNLFSIDLSFNSLTGSIPSSLFRMPSLSLLVLNNNQLAGPLKVQNISTTQLEYLNLSNNKLNEPIQETMISKLAHLVALYLSQVNLSEMMELEIFHELKMLWYLDLSGNRLSITNVSQNYTFPRLRHLNMSSCNINQFPEFLKSQSELEILDLSDNKLEGKVPQWLSNVGKETLTDLDVSYNFLSSLEQLPSPLPWTNMWYLNLHSNLFQGPLPIPPLSTTYYFASKNNFTGEFPQMICTLTSLKVLDLSDNHLSGSVPDCLGNISSSLSLLNLDLRSNLFQGALPIPPLSTTYYFASKNNFTGEFPQTICMLTSLEVLDLSDNHLSGSVPDCLGNISSSLSVLNLKRNRFHGNMPETFTTGSSLRTIDFSHNQLQGKVPESLVNCIKLEVLNLGNNHINDTFPFYLETLPELRVLVLRSNELHGPVWHSHTKFGFPELRIIDLSFNDFTGNIPSEYFRNWTSMMTMFDPDQLRVKYMENPSSYYQDTVTVMNKEMEMELVKTLTIFAAIDLSNNKFQGEIPDTIGNLKPLIVLNLSSNGFVGRIPLSFSGLTELESLDLSRNKLSGEIPQELASLTFLAVLNLSQNQLTGHIPQGGQFGTFPTSSFEGNPGLCGSPLPNKCEGTNTAPPESTSQESQSDPIIEFDWVVTSLGYGSGLIVGIVIGHIITSKKHEWFARTFGGKIRRWILILNPTRVRSHNSRCFIQQL